MKGLLLKEWYLGRKQCLLLALMSLVFFAATVLSNNYFFIVFAGYIGGLIPVTLIAYDDQSKWTSYSNILPYTRKQMVTAKYLLIILMTVVVLGMMCISGGVILVKMGTVDYKSLMFSAAVSFVTSVILPCIILPLFFKLGSEKGRIAYYVIVLSFSAMCGAVLAVSGGDSISIVPVNEISMLCGAIVFSVVWFVASWMMSVKFFEAREL